MTLRPAYKRLPQLDAADGFTLVDASEPAGAAVARVLSGKARLLMKGQVSTPSLLKAN